MPPSWYMDPLFQWPVEITQNPVPSIQPPSSPGYWELGGWVDGRAAHTTKVGYHTADRTLTFHEWISRAMTGRRGGWKWLRHGEYPNGRYGRC